MSEQDDKPDGGMTQHEATLTRVFDAPRELVFAAWTEPEQIARWWGPPGTSTPLASVEMDVRPGGVFRLTMVSDHDGSEFPSDMRFREVVAPERLAFGWEAQRGLGAGEVTVTFTDLGGRTEVETRWTGWATDEIAAGSQLAWAGQMDRLDAALAAA